LPERSEVQYGFSSRQDCGTAENQRESDAQLLPAIAPVMSAATPRHLVDGEIEEGILATSAEIQEQRTTRNRLHIEASDPSIRLQTSIISTQRLQGQQQPRQRRQGCVGISPCGKSRLAQQRSRLSEPASREAAFRASLISAVPPPLRTGWRGRRYDFRESSELDEVTVGSPEQLPVPAGNCLPKQQ